MNTELTANEYRDLLDILHIADVVISGHRREEDKRTGRHRALIQKLYALAQGKGLYRLISYNESAHKYVPTVDFEQSSLAHAVVDEFGEHLFWDELISRLTAQDAAKAAGGTDRLNAMSDIDRQAVEGPIRQRYMEEFSMHGVANRGVIEQLGIGGVLPLKTSD
jgi:hypothetical protein